MAALASNAGECEGSPGSLKPPLSALRIVGNLGDMGLAWWHCAVSLILSFLGVETKLVCFVFRILGQFNLFYPNYP